MKRKIALFVLIASLGFPLCAEENAVMIETISTCGMMVIYRAVAINISYERVISDYISWELGFIFAKSIAEKPPDGASGIFYINPFLNLRYYPGGHALMGWFLEGNVNYGFMKSQSSIRKIDETTRKLFYEYSEGTVYNFYFGAATGWKFKNLSGIPMELSLGATCFMAKGVDGVWSVFPYPLPKLTFSFGWLW